MLDPTNEKVHVSCIGHVDHGKTTLTAAITRVLAQANKINTYATTVAVAGLKMFRKALKRGKEGENVECLLSGVERNEIQRGQVLAQPGLIKTLKAFRAQIYVLTKEEGGRHTSFFSGYRSCYYMGYVDIVGEATLPDGVEKVMPGDNVEIMVKLTLSMAMKEGTRFACHS
jgi:elongation factor Tu